MYTSMTKASENGQPKTPAYRLRANRIHSRLKTLCHQWMVRHRPEVVAGLQSKARKEILKNGA